MASSPGHSCFAASSPHSLDAGAPSLAFPADSLSNSYDQFVVTLTVSSAGRNSPEAQVFLSPGPDSALRYCLPLAPCRTGPRAVPLGALPSRRGSHWSLLREKGAGQREWRSPCSGGTGWSLSRHLSQDKGLLSGLGLRLGRG